MPYSLANLGVADYLDTMVRATEHLETLIQSRRLLNPVVFDNIIQRVPYEHGTTHEHTIFRHHAGKDDMVGRAKWHSIQNSTEAADQNPGYNACGYSPYLIEDGMQRLLTEGFQTSRRTNHICLNDINNAWEFEQQLGLKMNFLSDITLTVWENIEQTTYIKFCVDAGRGYMLAEGAPRTYTFTYDPDVTDADGDYTATWSNEAATVSTLNWGYLTKYARELQYMATPAALGRDSANRPIFGLVIDMNDVDDYVNDNTQVRDNFHYGLPQVLINDFGALTVYKQFSFIHNMNAPRLEIKSQDGTNITAKFIEPYIESPTDMEYGNKLIHNPDYENAEYGMFMILLKDVYKLAVPSAGPSSVAGVNFGTDPSWMGEFSVINIPNEDNNLLGEVPFLFGRYRAYIKPGEYSDLGVCGIYRRCPHVSATDCSICGTDALGTSTEVGLSADSVATDLNDTNRTITLTLTGCLGCETGATVTLSDDSEVTCTGIISEASAAPTYTFALTAAPTAYTEWTADGPSFVTCA